MAKELPYFRFTVQEWQNGDIGIESYELKGLFIDICGFYWIKDCTTTLAMLQKRFSNATNLLEQLISLGILKVDEEQNVNIYFLDDQFDLLSEKRKKRQLAGRKGGLSKSSKAKAMLKQNSSYKDKDKEKDNNNTSRSFAADANRDLKGYRLYLYERIKEREASRETLFMQCKIDMSRRNIIWDEFIQNSITNSPMISDENHAWNTFKRYVIENQSKYQRNTKRITFDNE